MSAAMTPSRVRHAQLARSLGALLFSLVLASASGARGQNAPGPLKLKGTHAQELSIPADKPTLLLFLRPGQSQSEEALKLAAPLFNGRKDLQVLAIVSGDDAAAGAAQLEKNKCPCPVIADTGYEASGHFLVRVWPTVLVVGSKGEQVAHLPGLPVTFANDLGAYLDYATGKIDKAALDKQLANREVVADTEGQKAARHAEVALRLAEKGLRDQALAEVNKALELKPTDVELLLSLVRTDLMIEETKAAENLLAKLPAAGGGGANALPPGELNTLKGWAAIQAGRWADARQALEAATQLNPNPAQAYYLLGRVYEHDHDGKAGECYRKAFEHTAEGKPMAGG